MSLINKEVNDFKVQAYVGKDFKEVTKKDILGKWSVFFFYPADFTFVCPTELEDLANKYEEFKKIGWHGMMHRIRSKKYSIRCWLTRPGLWQEISM